MRHGDASARAGVLRAGFTLVEVLAALAVTALVVSVVLPFATRLADRWWNGEVTVEAADAWMQAMARMGDDLAAAVPYGLGPPDRLVPAFRAEERAIAFVRPAIGRRHGLETVVYAVRRTAGGEALVRSSRRFEPRTFASEPLDDGAAVTLIEGSFRFRLAEMTQDGTGGWSPADGMPFAVELSMADSSSTRRAPVPDMIMPIPARAPAIGGQNGTVPPARPAAIGSIPR